MPRPVRDVRHQEVLMSVKGANGSAKGSGRAGSDLKRADASGSGAAVDRSDLVRNVALVGHSGAGKTMLLEAVLASTGAISRMGSIVDGTTVGDSDPAAVHQQ